MPGYALDANTQMMCPHGGKVTVRPGESKVTVHDQAIFVLDDFKGSDPAISGCSFNISGSPSPCQHVKWMMAAQKVEISGSPVLTSTSVGLCLSAAQAPQGVAMVSGYQTDVEAM